MDMTMFISNLNKAWYLTPILLNKILLVEIRPYYKTSHYLELSARGAKIINTPPKKIDFLIEGDEQDIEDVLLEDVSLKQLISFGKISITGSYRDFLKLEAIIKLS